MKVFLDECIPHPVKKFLDDKGINTSSVTGLNLPDRSDRMVLEYVKVGGDMLVTSDRRMKTRNKFPPSPQVGIIYARVEPSTSKYLISALDEFLQSKSLKEVIGKSLILRRHDWEFVE